MDDKDKNRQYQRTWYTKNRVLHNQRVAANKVKLKAWFNQLKSKPCVDCNNSYPYYVMDFDHRPEEVKLFNLTQSYILYGKPKILAEAAKCDVVCANCHRERTHKRLNI